MPDNIETAFVYWRNQFNRVWERSDYLFSLLRSSEEYYKQPIKLRLPLIFYLGHLPCFSWYQFRHLDGISGIIDPTYDQLFERGVDPDVNTGIVTHGHSSQFSTDTKTEEEYWRSFTVQSVIDYKHKVRARLMSILSDGTLDWNKVQTLNILNVAIEHELLHHETLMYMFIQLPIDSLRLDIVIEQNLRQRCVTSPLADNTWVSLPSGQISLGKPYNDDISSFSFGWDNEFPSESVYIPDFELQSHPVRNGDFLEFILDGGYTTSDWWEKNVFEEIINSNIRYPSMWTVKEDSYYVNFVLQRDIPIASVLDHPVLVSQVEANAYCRWISKKTGNQIELPSEAEWVYAMWDYFKCLNIESIDTDYNVNFRHFHTIPVDSNNGGNIQWQGSAFEWTSSLFRPFSGYRGGLPSYPTYSSDFFDNQHFVLLGASFVTDSKFIRRTFRNWFQSNYRYVFATFRCIKRINHTDFSLTEVDRETIVAMLNNSEHRRIASKYFYDARGSLIYTRITQLNEYYLFKQELTLLKQHATDIKSTILRHSNFHDRPASTINFIELGCGDGSKVEAWLSPWIQSNDNVSIVYHPVDISNHAIQSLIDLLKKTMGEQIVRQHVKPVCSSFEDMYSTLNIDSMGVQAVMLLGSTIGNFASYGPNKIKYDEDAPVMHLLRSIRRNLRVGDWLICAFDMCKDTTTMIQAYSDSKGVTAEFNFNLLLRLNRELNFDFNLINYQHYATYNPLCRQIESWMISTKHQTVTDQHGFIMKLEPFDAIQTELSTKYTQEDIESLMEKNSLCIIKCYITDNDQLPYTLCMAQAI